MMMKTFAFLSGLLAARASAELVNGMYWDEWHNVNLPGSNVTDGINRVYISFIDPTVLSTDPVGDYTPFVSVDSARERFGASAKIILSVGGWSWTSPFANASANATARELFAKNVATMIETTGADGVDIDWEYPCGNGADYKQIPNSERTGEAETFPALLEAIRAAIGTDKELSIAVPGLQRDMICYTATTVPRIAATVDYFNIMTYDLMNRRDNITKHHSDVVGSAAAVDAYLSLGLPAAKAVMGFAFYAKYFTTDPASDCATNALGCDIVAAENEDGSDAGTSGAFTFETANMAPTPVPADIAESTDGSCGATAVLKCADSLCCSSSGWCGSTSDYCNTGCQVGYGNCTGPDVSASWARAEAGAISDTTNGGEYFWDSEANLFWTWDTPTFIQQKIDQIVVAKGLAGVMGWSLGEDTFDNSHILAVQSGVKAANAASA